MNTILTLLLVSFLLFSCSAERELQVEMSLLELKKIDTLYRHKGDVYLYTWYDTKNRVTYSEYRNDCNLTYKLITAMVRR